MESHRPAAQELQNPFKSKYKRRQEYTANQRNWSDPATWSADEPASGVTATINGGFTVAVDQAGEVAGILDLGTVAAQSGNLTVAAPGDLTVSTTMRVGQVAGSTGDVTMTGGLVTVNGATPSGFGDGDLIVGDVGNGTFTQSGDVNVADEIVIGLADVSTGVVNVSGENFRANGRSILVGFDGNGTLNVSGTGNVRANFDMLIGFLEGGVGNINLSGGAIEAGFFFTNSFTGPLGSTANVTQTGGAFNARIAFVLGQGFGTTTMNHSGGAINVPTNNGDMVVGLDGVGAWNLSGGAVNATNVFTRRLRRQLRHAEGRRRRWPRDADDLRTGRPAVRLDIYERRQTVRRQPH